MRRLRIPPAWKDVVIHPSPSGAVQAIGRELLARRRRGLRESEKAILRLLKEKAV